MFEIIGGGAVWNHANGELTVRAISVAPSRRRPGPHHQPVGSSARSIDSTVAVRNGGNTISFSESVTSAGFTSISSGVPGPGYFGGKAIKWLGEKGLNTIQFTLIKRRASSHVSCLEKWGKHPPPLGVDERGKVFEMLSDALEMSR
ncbi:hypothetical protein JB92DRAFT_2273613 [Gautieria morchelliformis]|nr:hypothetical protein JB92DRAFT_2273613 [Gautieria morchelliformis]